MPIYCYVHVRPDGSLEDEVIEILQSIKDAPLTVHPETGKPIKKVLPTNISCITGKGKSHLSNENLARKGFTKYERGKQGVYNKVAGSGPNQIKQ